MAYTKQTWTNGASGGTAVNATRMRHIEDGIAAVDALLPVFLDAFYQSADGNNYAPAIQRALTYAIPLGRPVLLQRLYPITSTVTLSSGAAIVGLGPQTGLIGPAESPITILSANGAAGITLRNFMVDGNTVGTFSTVQIRGLRLQNCTDVRLKDMTVQRCDDWGSSFENCTQVSVIRHTHLGSGGSNPGGRDGIHFLDCRNVLVDGAFIHSGDDCIGITSQTRDIWDITIRNVVGHSVVAAVVTVGNEAATTFSAYGITVQNVSTSSPTGISGVPPYVVKVRAQNGSTIQGVRISGVYGDANSYGVWVEGSSGNRIEDVHIADVAVTSATGHGVYVNYLEAFTLVNVDGRANAGSFDGVNVSNCFYGTLSGVVSRASALWGIQVNTCTNVDLFGCVARECGGPNFAAGNGGGLRIASSTSVAVQGGTFSGSTTVSRFGISEATNTGTVISTFTRRGGATP